MSFAELPSVGSLNTIEDIKTYLHQQERTMRYLLEGRLSTKNVMEIGGWYVSENLLMSVDGDVGFSTDDSLAINLRMWAGAPNAIRETAPYRVYSDGSFVATDADITGSIHMTSGTISWGTIGAPDYDDIGGPKPPTNADNTAANLQTALGSNFTVIGPDYIYSGTISGSQIFGGTITGVVYNAFDPLTPSRKLMIRPSTIDGAPDLTFWNEASSSQARGALYVTSVGGQDFFTMFSPSGIQITSPDTWFNGFARFGNADFSGNVDFTGATVTGINTTAKFG